MEVIDLEPKGVLAALESAFLASSNGDYTLVETAANDINVTSMWRLKNGQQVAKVSVPRDAKPTEVSRVRIGWTSFRLRICHPEATRCFKYHCFGHSQGS
ncbi:unnamed protein product [Macrosiphum euphorbiae]|uniref:Uncharacterized protein n=1 Tax=Macrosiphum euphorbiae TaxID=13131 RepID=A0AAV0W8B6_9HEMI|nr:unnamed protein product [Macrosiphum euphorbiae]